MADSQAGAGKARCRGGLIVIGDEVLQRRVDERNIAAVLDAFARYGIEPGEVAILADDVDRIAQVVRDFAARFDLVLTTGGVGPTHDDLTWQAVAQATDDALVLRQDVVDAMEARAGKALTPKQRRMAVLPSKTEVELLPAGGFAMHTGHVWVLPGVPSMAARKLDGICARYQGQVPAVVEAYFTADEWDVVAAIDVVVAAHPAVQIGSYPLFDPSLDHRLRVSLRAEGDAVGVAAVVAALAELLAAIGEGKWVRTTWRSGGPAET